MALNRFTFISKPGGKYLSQFDRAGYYNQDAVYLNAGAPSKELLKTLPPMIEAATKHCMDRQMNEDGQIFQYGVENGDYRFQMSVAKFLTEEYGDAVDSDQIFLTGGASSGLWLITSCLFKAGSLIFIEDPSYFLAMMVFNDLGITLVPVKTDDNGIVPESLEERLIKHFSKNPSPCNPPLRAMIYLVPTFHNPTGSVLPPDRCRKVVSLARKYGALVVCDDVYNLLHHEDVGHGPKRLFMFDEKSDPDYVGNVISNGSFSKFFGPGFRVGWMETPKWAIPKLEDFGVIVSGGGLNTFTSGIITSLLEMGKMQEHLHETRQVFKSNMEAVAEILRTELPPGCKLKSAANGGYFLWIELPKNVSVEKLIQFAIKNYRVHFSAGSRSSATNGFQNYIRICISFYPKDVLLPATRKVCQAISDFEKHLE